MLDTRKRGGRAQGLNELMMGCRRLAVIDGASAPYAILVRPRVLDKRCRSGDPPMTSGQRGDSLNCRCKTR